MSGSAWSGVSFQQNEQVFKYRNAVPLFKSNTEAYELIKSAKSNYDLANVIGFVGGFMVGWPLGTAIRGGDPNWGLAAAGASLIVIAIPIINSAKKKAQSAIDKYNSSLKAVSVNTFKPTLEFGSTKTRVGLRFTF